jgi:FimV-like protein
LAILLAAAVLPPPLGWSQAPTELERARALYRQTRYGEAVRILEASRVKNPSAYALLGQSYYMLEEYKKSSEALERAVAGDAANAVYVNWLGRAFGKRAENAFPLIAPSYASKARQYFEKAVQLDPLNLDALDDLFEFYLQAPGMLGGGVDKAEALSERIRERAPAKYYSMQARIAEKQKRMDLAESNWRKAVQAAPSEPGRLVDLARFLAKQSRHAESDAAFEQAQKLAPNYAPLKFQRARTYIDSGRHPELARELLREYLSSTLTPDDPSRAEAQRLLDKLARG